MNNNQKKLTLYITYLSRKATEEGIPKMTQGESKVLVKEVLEKLAHAEVGPTSMY